MQHEVMGQHARFERFIADKIFCIAAGRKIDDKRSKPFSELVDEIYANPFEKAKQTKEMSAEEIKAYIVERLED